MRAYLSADIIYSEKRTFLRELSSSKTVSFEEQIMSTDNFMPNGGCCVYYPLKYFSQRAVLKIGEYPWIFPCFGLGISIGHMTRLD